MHISLYPHIFLTYCVLSGFVGISCISFFITLILAVLLEKFKNEPAPPGAVKRVLHSEKTSIIGHRGAAHDAPENTVAAFKKAKENGADAVEFDLEFSRDGVAVIVHDDTVDRTTDGTGPVKKFSYEDLQVFNASAKHPKSDDFPNEKIPSLEEGIQVCLDLGLKMYLDVKGDSCIAVSSIISMFKKYPALYDNAVVCSFWPQVPYRIRRADPRIVTGLTHRHKVLTRKVDGTERSGPLYKRVVYPVIDVVLEWAMHSWLWYLCGTSAYLCFVQDVSANMVQKYADKGIHVVVWTANSPAQKSFIAEQLKCSYMTDTLQEEEGCGQQKN